MQRLGSSMQIQRQSIQSTNLQEVGKKPLFLNRGELKIGSKIRKGVKFISEMFEKLLGLILEYS
jgi:hypothetical protein